ncbi:TPA: hypothetical protein IZ328_002225 [Enterococcus faecium]|uniref:hypothetical protein n=1 Tax=Enterococcus faecium TaxID=1352 RepID=UPI0021E9059D|nr:hypothetical protein [Enterococcus faecium]MCV3205004.1 hypothetical protein [Enterococcus faecium]MCV6663341.1 hypothetical protein [Enterococcus faecium]HAR1385847.1 hypothetical protein [Enterococcus faecium]HAR1388697.1 hypothetical protein [Enterococcus faecium]HAR1399937.1 hypothetical protein [Enterococcus faecium]
MNDLSLVFLFVAVFLAGRLTGVRSGRNNIRMEFIELIGKAREHSVDDNQRIGWLKCLSYLLDRI